MLCEQLLVALWLVQKAIGAPSPAPEPIPTSPNTTISNSSLSASTLAALEFEYTTWTDGSVLSSSFYTVPANTHGQPAGSLLKLEKHTSPTNYSIPPGLSLSRIIYQSRRLNGSLVPASAYILWPYAATAATTRHDGYPVVAFAHGTSGYQANCGPSHLRNLWQHFLAPYPLAYQGYVVVAPDYAGMGVSEDALGRHIIHEYAASPAAANDVVYAVQAAQSAFEELSRSWVVMGHSQGGGAAWAVAQRQAKQPVEGYLGAVAVAPLTTLLDKKASTFIQYIALIIATGAASYVPAFDPLSIATEVGRRFLEVLARTGGCSSTLDTLIGPADALVSPVRDWQANAAMQSYLNDSANGGREIAGPMLVIQGEADATVDPQWTRDAVKHTLDAFPESHIDFRLLPGLDHVPSLEASQMAWQKWIAARFAGEKVKAGLDTSTSTPARPVAHIQTTLNWWIAPAENIWETP